MAKQARRRRTGREPLSRGRILRAAFDLADAEGLGALTMHNIGHHLDVEAMSLYRHVANKEDILDGLVDLVMAEIELPGGLDWKAALRHRSIAAREAFRRHRWSIGLVESRDRPGPATLAHHEAVLAVLLNAGFSGVLAGRAYNLLDSYIYGFAMQEASLPFETIEEQSRVGDVMLQQLPVDQYPNMVRVTREFGASGALLADFEFGLDLLLDGIERARALG